MDTYNFENPTPAPTPAITPVPTFEPEPTRQIEAEEKPRTSNVRSAGIYHGVRSALKIVELSERQREVLAAVLGLRTWDLEKLCARFARAKKKDLDPLSTFVEVCGQSSEMERLMLVVGAPEAHHKTAVEILSALGVKVSRGSTVQASRELSDAIFNLAAEDKTLVSELTDLF